MATRREILNIALTRIKHKGLEENVGLLLMEEIEGLISRTDLLCSLDSEMINESQYLVCLMEYLSGKPLQYIIKKAWFYGNTFYVDNRVLIPRMETEELVDAAIKIARDMDNPVIYDICTGSGCIALSLGINLSNARIVGSDISKEALEVANINRNALKVENVSFIESNLFINYPLTYVDMIVSNPPYVDQSETLEAMVKDYEPSLALIPPSGNGLEFYQRIFTAIPNYLKNGGYLLCEFGTNQKESIQKLANELLANSKITFYKDISSKDRYFVLQYFRLN